MTPRRSSTIGATNKEDGEQTKIKVGRLVKSRIHLVRVIPVLVACLFQSLHSPHSSCIYNNLAPLCRLFFCELVARSLLVQCPPVHLISSHSDSLRMPQRAFVRVTGVLLSVISHHASLVVSPSTAEEADEEEAKKYISHSMLTL